MHIAVDHIAEDEGHYGPHRRIVFSRLIEPSQRAAQWADAMDCDRYDVSFGDEKLRDLLTKYPRAWCRCKLHTITCLECVALDAVLCDSCGWALKSVWETKTIFKNSIKWQAQKITALIEALAFASTEAYYHPWRKRLNIT